MSVLKLQGARQRMKSKAGRCEGRKPYGLSQAERETIQRMKALRARQYSYANIAAALVVKIYDLGPGDVERHCGEPHPTHTGPGQRQATGGRSRESGHSEDLEGCSSA
jgi:hypothetical protein